MGAASTTVLRLRLLVASVAGSPASGRVGAFPGARSGRSLLVHYWCRDRVLASWDPLLVSSSSTLRQLENLSVVLGFSRLWIRFSSSHCWSLLHWRHLSMFRLASAVDCCLSSLRGGDCGLLRRRRVPARVLMVACLPLLRVWRTVPSHVPLMLCASTGFPVNPGLF